ncbi:type IV secretory pathway VirD2 relaxase [Novosphingobium gossypii]
MRHDLRRAVNQAGGARKAAGSGKVRFTGVRTGRGSVTGRMLGGSSRSARTNARRVVVKARYVRLAGKGIEGAARHLRYLEREGTTRDGERGSLYGPEENQGDRKEFLERCGGDRHQFRFIVSPEDGERYEDLKSVTRRLMTQMEKDLGTRLDWVAVDHFDTGHPHTHIVVRGVDDLGKNLVIARDYISTGLAARASEIVGHDLGPRSEHEIARANEREVTQERFTRIDRRLRRDIDDKGLASAWHSDPVEQGLRAARLGTLSRMGLATEEGKGLYRLDPDLEATLREMGKRGDIIATMHEQLRARPEVLPQDYAIFDRGENQPIVGKVLSRGLSDELRDRHYLIVEATDGRSHYVDLGSDRGEGAAKDRLVRIAPSSFGIRTSDQTIAGIAAANGGMYSRELHRQHDPSATTRFIEAYDRRLEALRHGGIPAFRGKDGTWTIAPDYLEKVKAFEQRLAIQTPVAVEVLADRPLNQLARHDGPTWLDHQCLAEEANRTEGRLEGRMGGEVKTALQLRRQWLIEQGLAEQMGDTISYRANMLGSLRQRELRRVAGQLSRELGLKFVPMQGEHIAGTYRKAIQMGSEKFAVIEKSREFTLVPWRPVLEKHIGRQVAGGLEPGGTITWRFGRQQSGPEIS